MKVALVQDWLVSYAGSERVLAEFASLYPDAPIYTSIYDEDAVGSYFPRERVHSTFLQKLPGAIKRYQTLLPLMPLAFEQLDLRAYDLVISSSHACSKGVLTRPDALHICYCHTPIRYAWSHYHEYLETIRHPMKRSLAAYLLSRLRIWDYAAAGRVDFFVANSDEVQQRIQKYYRRDSVVIHPPVKAPEDTSSTIVDRESLGDYYLSLGRLVPYKRVDLAIEACKRLGKKLVIVGDGPEGARLREMAKEDQVSIRFLGSVSEADKTNLLGNARALLFCGEEDFGIVPVEASRLGVPVIGYGKGGLLDSIVPAGEEKTANGVLFEEQTVESVRTAILDFESQTFDRVLIQQQSARFDPSVFREKWLSLLTQIRCNK